MRTPLALVAAVGVCAGFASAQPREDGPVDRRDEPGAMPREVAEPGDAPPQEPAEARKFLERRLEEMTKRQQKLRDALKRLDDGVPVREALRGLDPRGDHGRGQDGDEPRMGMERPLDRERGERRRGEHAEGEPAEGGRRPERAATPEARQHAHAFLREHLPALADKVEAQSRKDPEQADRNFARLMPRLAEAENVMRRDPELFKLRLRDIEATVGVVEAIKAYRDAAKADPAHAEQPTQALRSALGAQMDARMNLQAHEIQALGKRTEDMKADLDKKRGNRDAAIDDMLRKIKDFKDGEGRRGEPEPRHEPR